MVLLPLGPVGGHNIETCGNNWIAAHPTNWPANITWTATAFDRVGPRPTGAHPIPLLGAHNVEIRIINNVHHPANGQRGVFATANIGHPTTLGEYSGERYTVDSERGGGKYAALITIIGNQALIIDATRYGNEHRFINDYRGIANAPNVRMVADIPNSIIEIETLVPLNQDDELLLDYGRDYWKGQGLEWIGKGKKAKLRKLSKKTIKSKDSKATKSRRTTKIRG